MLILNVLPVSFLPSLLKFSIVPMMTVCVTDRMGDIPIPHLYSDDKKRPRLITVRFTGACKQTCILESLMTMMTTTPSSGMVGMSVLTSHDVPCFSD